MKKGLSILLSFALAMTLLAGCTQKKEDTYVTPAVPQTEMSTTEEVKEEKKEDVVILYTNDTHTYINNTETDENENVIELLSFDSVAALKQDLQAEGKNVLLVDAGDHAQGTAYGALNEGDTIITLMNAAGYDVATLGNHEFDYGMFRTFALMDEAEYPYISCNFYNEDGSLVLAPYQIFELGGNKIAFIGITTPESISKSTPAYFMDETMDHYIYSIAGGADGSELYEAVQKTIDEVRDDVDYVIGLGHMGIDEVSAPFRSTDVIENTTGLDAFIDGHSHTVMPLELVKDKDGKDVVLTQTGNYFSNIGMMTLSDGKITTELVSEYENRAADISTIKDGWVGEVNAKLGEQIAVSDVKFTMMSPNDPEERIVRKQGCNVGDFVADSFYYYFNEVEGLNCDIVIQNGGGIRSDIEEGPVTYETAKANQPFGNVVCLVEVSGQDILDAIEFSTIGLEPDGLEEYGGFMHIAGARYSVDTTKESTVSYNENELWMAGPTDGYRVEVEIYNKETCEYEPLDVNKTYALGGINYILRNCGSGMMMLSDTTLIKDYCNEDYLALAEYMKSFKEGDDGYPHISSENSPLKSYEGYVINYENPFGDGRIKIIVQ